MKLKLDKGLVKLDGNIEYATTGTVKEVGNGAHVNVLKRFRNREALIVILKEKSGAEK